MSKAKERPNTIGVWVSDEELALIREAAKQSCMPTSTYIRSRIIPLLQNEKKAGSRSE